MSVSVHASQSKCLPWACMIALEEGRRTESGHGAAGEQRQWLQIATLRPGQVILITHLRIKVASTADAVHCTNKKHQGGELLFP